MTVSKILMAGFTGLSISLALGQPRPVSATIAITHAAVVDTKGGPIQRDMTVIIQDHRISAVVKSENVPRGAQVLDGRGKYLIPGLWDMHVHSLNTAWIETFFPLFIASGVTGTRDMARPLTDLELFKNRWSKEIAAGSRIGPRVVAAGPSIDGPKRVFPYLSVQTETEGREAVRMLRQHGVDFIKVYSGLPRDIYFAIADEVKKQELSFVGHPPNAVSPIEASDAGQKSFEHLFTVLIGCSKKEDELRKEAVAAMIRADGPNSLAAHAQAEARSVESYDHEKATALFARLAANGTWQVPTLALLRGFAFYDDPAFMRDNRLRFITPELREQWDKRRLAPSNDPFRGDAATRRRLFEKQLEVVGAMNRASVPIMAGTDTPGNFLIPGFALHDELALLVKAGLTPLEALRAATLNPAKFLNLTDSLGSIEAGKIADMVLLDDDPLKDIQNTQKINAVVANGRLFNRRELDSLLEEIAKANAQSKILPTNPRNRP